VSLRWYRSDLTNEIGYDPSANGPYGPGSGANVNYDPTRRRGLEIDVRQALSEMLDVSLNAALRQAKFRSGPHSGKNVPLVPARTISLHSNWRPLAGHSLDAGVMWVSEQHSGGDFANGFKMPAYTTVDLRYAYQYKQAELALGITNLLNARYYSQAYLNFLGTDVGIYPEAGRTVTASLRVKF
jgi:iron complex outermembrane receptor protein